jgi:ABC-2 type transport system ATP-binding protein
MTEWMIEAERLTKYFDAFLAVDGVNLQVKKGEILVLLGPNGAGKTTTVRMLTSILRPSSGWARVAGYDVVQEAAKVRGSVGVLTEHHGLYGRMNADEYLEFFGRLYGVEPNVSRPRINKFLDQFGLTNARKKRLGEYSKGMRQKLALVRTLLHEPPVILLDEPTSAMDPESAFTVRAAIQTLKSADRTLILCTHNLKEAEELADQIAIIKSGRIILNGRLDDVRRKLVGPQEFEVRFSTPLNGYEPEEITGCVYTAAGENWLRFTSEDPTDVNPRVIQTLVNHELPVQTVEEVHHSLEDIYLQTVSQEQPK